MATALINFASQFLSLSWLTGPIFDKELRVSSRRRRNYVLRFAYLALLTVFVAFVWLTTVSIGAAGSTAFQLSRMPEAGKHIISTIVWFQFIAAQLIAIVMLSTAINDEIYRRTLGVLMTTPINSFQIVMGKLFSKLLQLILLLAISLPLLAIVRVFGGIPWHYVISSLCVTLTAAVFAGSISLFFSIHAKKAHEVVITAIFACLALYLVLPGLIKLLSFAYESFVLPDIVLSHINPFMVMTLNTKTLHFPSAAPPAVSWPLHCAIMTGGSALLLALSTLSVRKAGLRRGFGQPGILSAAKERRIANAKRAAQADSPAAFENIRHVKGPPLIWKEMKIPFIRGGRLKHVIASTLALIVLSVIYGYCARQKCLHQAEVQMAFIAVYLFLGLFGTATTAASSITSEKEAHTWPTLLTTPLDKRQIVFSKIVGSCLRCWPFWLLLTAHTLIFTCARCIHPLAVCPLVLLFLTSALLVSTVGVFLSSCFKRTAPAAAVNLVLFFIFTVPSCCPLPTVFISPLFVTIMILSVAAGPDAATTPFYKLEYGPWAGIEGFFTSMLILIGIMIIYLLIALLFFAIAKSNIRRKIF